MAVSSSSQMHPHDGRPAGGSPQSAPGGPTAVDGPTFVKRGVTWCKRPLGSLSSDCSELRGPCCKPTHANKW